MKPIIKQEVEKIYGKDFENNETFKKDFEEAKSLPSKTHTAVADLSNYLPKVLEKADEVVTKVNAHDESIENLEGTVETHGMAIKGLTNNKAGKEETEKALGDLTERITTEEKNRKSNYRKLNGAIKNVAKETTKKFDEMDASIKAIKTETPAVHKEILDRHDKEITENKKSISDVAEISAKKDKELDGKIVDNKEAIRKNKETIEHAETGLVAAHKKADDNKAAIAAGIAGGVEKDKEHDAAIVANRESINHLDQKVNTVAALGVALAGVDLNGVPVGKLGIGAGVGHFVNKQAVAVGIAYAPTADFKVNAKWAATPGEIKYNAISVGASYYIDLN